MATLGDILASKPSGLLTIRPTSTALDAIQLMNEHNVGCLVVTHRRDIVGIFTERDVLRRVAGRRRRAAAVCIEDVMTRQVICGGLDMPIDEARTIMKHKRIRHLPVLEQAHRAVGMISIGDINAWALEHLERENHYLHEYLHGAVA